MDDKQFEQVVDKYISNQESLKILHRIELSLWLVILLALVLLALVASHSVFPVTHADETRPTETYTPTDAELRHREVSLSTEPATIKDALRQFLAKKQSPFKEVDLLAIARQVGISDQDVILLLAITGKESEWGKTYARSSRYGTVLASEEGLAFHNASGMKHVHGCANVKLPTERGFWIDQCPDWITFFRGYFTQFKVSYKDKGCGTAECMRFYWVGGTWNNQYRWLKDVNLFKKELTNTL